MQHTRISASKFHRLVECPGSLRMEEGKEDFPSESAIEGTHTHKLLETCINDSINDPTLFLGKELESDAGKFTVSVDQVHRVRIATDYIRQRIKELGPNCEILKEHTVDIGAKIGITEEPIKGTADIILVNEDVIEIIDYKDGFIPVDVTNNYQLLSLAIGYDSAQYMEKRLDTLADQLSLRLTIIQPRMRDQRGLAVSTVSVSYEGLLAARHELKNAVLASYEPDAVLNPGESQCQWCRARGSCPALSEKSLTEAQVLFEGEVSTPVSVANMDSEHLDNYALSQIMQISSLLTLHLKAVEAEVLSRIKTGNLIKGFKLVEGPGRRKWIDEEKLLTKLKSMGVPKGLTQSHKTVSPAQVEKLIWKNRKEEPKRLNEKQLEALKKMAVRSQGSLTVVSEEDPRQSVNPSEVFKDVESLLTSECFMPGVAKSFDDDGNAIHTPPYKKPKSIPDWLT